MPIYDDIFSINQVYELMVDGEWVTTPYVLVTAGVWFGGGASLSRVDLS